MPKELVAFFSPTGNTRKIAIKIADSIGADIWEIEAKRAYSAHDLDWQNKSSRSSVEMSDKNSRPEIKDDDLDITPYDTVFIGFPIWWYTAPRIINTFLESHDFSGKNIVLFCTSGSCGLGNTEHDLASSAKGALFKGGRRFMGSEGPGDIKDWAALLLS